MTTTTLCYIENDDKFLMLHRVKKQDDMNEGKWIGVGGHVESQETPEECLVREVKEETGLTLEITDLPIGNKGGYSSAGMTDETCTLVVGKVTGKISDKYKEASEEIEVLLVDKKEAARILKEENVCIR